jgi:hypothetical protein
LANAGEVQTSRMSYVQRDEGHQGAYRYGRNAVPQHAEPGIDLGDLFPPVVLNDEIGGRWHRPTDKCQCHYYKNENADMGRTHKCDL